MKREGISTLFIHGFPWALSYLLDHLFFFLKSCFCMVLESIWKRCHRLGKLCNDSRLYKNAYKVLDFFENISCFESVWCVFEKMFVLKRASN